jgi:hypothetical protein
MAKVDLGPLPRSSELCQLHEHARVFRELSVGVELEGSQGVKDGDTAGVVTPRLQHIGQ